MSDLSIATPYIMDQLLALYAQYLMITCIDQSDAYHDLAIQLQTRTSHEFQEGDGRHVDGRVVARILFSSLVSAQAFVQKPSAKTDKFRQVDIWGGGLYEPLTRHFR
ncbi:hypothetical protein F5Y05DRAFT_104862 [Hypoxylon sp. FL0543]|nr:hypothetical protein F5Y05DRAFT_104862 [Hypoxylon sp. FL0543]